MTHFDISPDGTYIVYSTCEYPIFKAAGAENNDVRHYQYEIGTVRVDGTRKRRLTANNSYENYPTWSPDGGRVAFISFSSGHWRDSSVIKTMSTDRSELRVVTAAQIRYAPARQAPVWSPDGKHIAFVKNRRYEEEAASIYTVGADGSDLREITETVSGPSWSPDGERIAFAKAEDKGAALYTIAADGSDTQRVTAIYGWQPQDGAWSPAEAWIQTVEWSPDGSKILYTCRLFVCVVKLDGTPVGTSPIAVEGGPVATWSPDGSRIAITSAATPDRNREVVLYGMAPDGSYMQVLARVGVGVVAKTRATGISRPAVPRAARVTWSMIRRRTRVWCVTARR